MSSIYIDVNKSLLTFVAEIYHIAQNPDYILRAMDIGKIFLLMGAFLILLGTGWSFGLGRLPGDIMVRRGNFTFAFPIVTSIILSIILTLLINFFFSRER